MSAAKERGQVLIMVIAITTVVTIAMASFGMFISWHTRANQSLVEGSQALFIAEAAMQRAIGHLQGQTNWKTASLPSPNPMVLPDSTNQARVSYLSRNKTTVTVKAEGYILASGYTLPAAGTPAAAKVKAHTTIQATLNKIRTDSIWNYAAYGDRRQASFNAVVHGSIFARSGDFSIGSGESVYNDYSYSVSTTPSWLQSYLDSLSTANLKASVKALNGNIVVSGTGGLGTAANPLSSIGLNGSHTVNVANYYSRVVTVATPGSFPAVSANQLDGIVFPLTEYDYRYVAGDLLSPDNGCVWDGNLVTDASKNLSITLGGDTPNCTPYGGNGIVWQPGNSKLIVNGTIFVDGNLVVGDSTYTDIVYEGRGLLVVNGTVSILAGLHPQNMTDFPETAQLGIVTRSAITIDPPDTTPYKVVAGSIYAGNDKSITINLGTILVGSAAADRDIITSGPPIFYQIPALATTLLPGMPDGGGTSFYITVTDWKTV